jgi:hypothetical protein
MSTLKPRRSSQVTHQNQTTVGGNPSALEIDLQRAVEGELKGPILCLTHRHAISAPSRSQPNPCPSARLTHFTNCLFTEITEIRVKRMWLWRRLCRRVYLLD